MTASNGFDVRHRSRTLTEGPERAAARAYLKGIGYSQDERFRTSGAERFDLTDPGTVALLDGQND